MLAPTRSSRISSNNKLYYFQRNTIHYHVICVCVRVYYVSECVRCRRERRPLLLKLRLKHH